MNSLAKNTEMDVVDFLKGEINDSNFFSFLNSLKWTKTFEFDLTGTPVWFQSMVTYYGEKDRIISLLSFFSIDYPDWIHEFTLPQDYTEEQLLLLFSSMDVSNESFTDSMEDFYFLYCKNNGNINMMCRSTHSFKIPFFFILQNPNLLSKKMFSHIQHSVIQQKKWTNILFSIQKYQKIPSPFIKFLSTCLSSKLSHHHIDFIQQNPKLLKDDRISNLFEDMMTENTKSPFYFLYFPKSRQKKFLLHHKGYFGTKMSLLFKMNLPEEEQESFIKELFDDIVKA